MPDTGFRPPSMPAPYRLLLAVSLAILAHTLVLAGLPSPLKEARELTHRLVFTLTTPAAVPTPENVASPEPPKPRHSEFEIPPAEPVVTSTESTSSAPPESQTVTATQPDSPKRTTESTQTRATSFESPASVATPALTARASEAVETPEPVKQKTETPDERDPFVAKLSSHLSEYLFRETIRVPVDSEGSKTWIAEIELRLMGNGAVTGAKIVKSTDLKDVDAAIYRAALEASPYPAPESGIGGRFTIKLKYRYE